MDSPFWLLVFGLVGIWFITSGRALAIINALVSIPASSGANTTINPVQPM